MGFVKFDNIRLGHSYDRNELAKLWGYKGYQAFGKGVFTPAGQNKIVLLLTLEHRPEDVQYRQSFDDGILTMEGETRNGSDARLVNSIGHDEVHLFLRQYQKSDFIYHGEVSLIAYDLHTTQPSVFTFTTLAKLVTELDKDDTEGERRERISVYYERSAKNRAKAIRYHGTSCLACGFNFDRFYGEELAKSYIQIHHTVSITEIGGRVVDPKMELIPLCANCHAMVHQKRGEILSLETLKNLIWNQESR